MYSHIRGKELERTKILPGNVGYSRLPNFMHCFKSNIA